VACSNLIAERSQGAVRYEEIGVHEHECGAGLFRTGIHYSARIGQTQRYTVGRSDDQVINRKETHRTELLQPAKSRVAPDRVCAFSVSEDDKLQICAGRQRRQIAGRQQRWQ